MCAKRLLTKQLKFNRFWDEYDRVRFVPVNFIEVIRKYQGRLGLDDLSLETILNKYGEGVKEDSFENVQGMRMCTVTAARKLHMNPISFIEQGLDSSNSESFSDHEDFEAELLAALLLSAEDQGGPSPSSEFSEDTHTQSPRRQTPSNANTPSSDEEDSNSGALGLPQDGASGGASASAVSGGHQECKICFTKIQEFCIIQPCGHASQCYKCARQIYRRDGKCPFCRKNIASIQKIFFN